MAILSKRAIQQLQTLALGGTIADGDRVATAVYIDGVLVWPIEGATPGTPGSGGLTLPQILAGVDTDPKNISAATLHAALESFDEILARRTIIRTDVNSGLVKNTPFYQIIPGRQLTADERAADAYIKAGVSASPALISDILGWDEDSVRYTITRQTEDPGYAVAQSNTGIWRRASGIRLPGGTVLQWYLDGDVGNYPWTAQIIGTLGESAIPALTLALMRAGSSTMVSGLTARDLRTHLVESNNLVARTNVSINDMEARKQYNAAADTFDGSYIQIIDQHQVSPGTVRSLAVYLRAGDDLDSGVTDLILQWDTVSKYTIAPRTPSAEDVNQNTWSTPVVANDGIWRRAQDLLLPAGTVIEWKYEASAGYYPWSGVIIGNINIGDDSRGLHPSTRIDYDRIVRWFNATPDGGIVQVISGGYRATTETAANRIVYLRSTAGAAIEAGFQRWDTAQRYTISGGVATAAADGPYRRAQDVILPVGAMIQWLRGENGRQYGVGRIFFGPGGDGVKPDWNAMSGTAAEILNKPPSGTAAEAIAGTIEDDRVWAPDEINSAVATLARIIHGNELHDPAFATESDLDAERQIRFQADTSHRAEANLHGVVTSGYWQDTSGYGNAVGTPVTYAAPSVTLGSAFRAAPGNRFTNGLFNTATRRGTRWGFAFAGSTVYLGIVGYSIPSSGGASGQSGPTGQQSLGGLYTENDIGLLQYTAAGAQVGTDTVWRTSNPLTTGLQAANVLQGYVAGSNIYWLMADRSGNGFSLTAYNLATGAFQGNLSRARSGFSGAPSGNIRGAWGNATRQFLCFSDGSIREYNPTSGAFVKVFATLPAGSTGLPAAGRLRGDATHLYVLTGSSAATAGFVAYDLATGMLDPEVGLTSFGLTSAADLWDFNVVSGQASLFYSTLPTDYPTNDRGFSTRGYVSAQRSASYGLPSSGLVLVRSAGLPNVVIPGVPQPTERDANFVEAVYQALLRGDTPGDGKTVSYDPVRNAIALAIQASLPGLTFTPTTSGDDYLVRWAVSETAPKSGTFRLNDIVGSGEGGSSTFLGLTDVTENSYAGHGLQIVRVNQGATGLEFAAAASGTFLGLTDVAEDAYTGHANQQVIVNSTATGLSFASGAAGSFLGLTDVDETTLAGHGGQFVSVNTAGTGLVFTPPGTLYVSNLTPQPIAQRGVPGVDSVASRRDHVHAGVLLTVGTTPRNTPGSPATGVGLEAARWDHDHGITSGSGDGADLSGVAPPAIAAAGAPGTGTTAARGDHTHAGVQLAASTSTPVNTATPTAGSGTTAARDDHDHGFTRLPLAPSTATPVNTPGTAAVGSASTAARADHDHGIAGGGQGVTLTYSTANPVNTPGSPSAGSATAVARSDHDHGITSGGRGTTIIYSSAAPRNTPGSPTAGTGSAVARANHDHGISPGIRTVRRNATLTGNGRTSDLGIAIPIHTTVVRGIFDRMQGTAPLAVTINSAETQIGFNAATLVSRLAALEAAAIANGWTI